MNKELVNPFDPECSPTKPESPDRLRIRELEAALKFYSCPNHVPDGPTLDVCREYCRMANEVLDGKGGAK